MDRYFRLSERGTSVRQEMVAGATTFAAMAYIIAVNPSIMSQAGMDRADLVIATAAAAIFGCVMMALTSNLPLAVAPAMGSNVVFTFTVVKGMGVPWQGALAMVAFTGIVFLIMSLTKLRERVAKDVPEALKIGIQAAVGTLIVFIGLRGSGFVVANPSTFVAMGSLKSPAVILTLVGLLVTPVLVVRRVPGALIISIVALTVIGLFVPGKYRSAHRCCVVICERNQHIGIVMARGLKPALGVPEHLTECWPGAHRRPSGTVVHRAVFGE